MPQRLCLQNGFLLPLPFHPVSEAVQRQGSGGTRKGVSELGKKEGTGLQKTLSPQSPRLQDGHFWGVGEKAPSIPGRLFIPGLSEG